MVRHPISPSPTSRAFFFVRDPSIVARIVLEPGSPPNGGRADPAIEPPANVRAFDAATELLEAPRQYIRSHS